MQTYMTYAGTNFYGFCRRRPETRQTLVRETLYQKKNGPLYLPGVHHSYYLSQKAARHIGVGAGNQVRGILENGRLVRIANYPDHEFREPVLFTILRDANWQILSTSGTKIMPGRVSGYQIIEQKQTLSDSHGIEYVTIKGRYYLSHLFPWEKGRQPRYVSLVIDADQKELLFFSYAERFAKKERTMVDAILFSRLEPSLFKKDEASMKNTRGDSLSKDEEGAADNFLKCAQEEDLLDSKNLESAHFFYEEALQHNPFRLELVPKVLEVKRLLDLRQRYRIRNVKLCGLLDKILEENYSTRDKIQKVKEFIEEKETCPLDVASLLALAFRSSQIADGIGRNPAEISGNVALLYPSKNLFKLMLGLRILWKKKNYRTLLEESLKKNRSAPNQKLKKKARMVLELLRAKPRGLREHPVLEMV